MNQILELIRQDLKLNSDDATRKSGLRFFKEDVRLYGVKSATVSAIGKTHYKSVKGLEKSEIFDICEELWQSGFMEESFIACHWSYYLRAQYSPSDLAVFERWIAQYVSNWASCDTLCNHTVGTFVEMFPDSILELKRWAGSENRWMRRASSVSLIIPAKNGLFLSDIMEIAEILLTDQDDMVQKGYGWMLKSASHSHLNEVFDFIISKKHMMPRTSLRYAIEKMPEEMKKRAMEK